MKLSNLALLCLLFTSCVKTNHSDFMKVVSSSFAKEYCSCLYIEKQKPKACYDYASQILKVDSYQVDEKHNMVIAKAYGYTSSSQFQNEKFGCSLAQ